MILFIVVKAFALFLCKSSEITSDSLEKLRHFKEVDFPTPNYEPDSVNEVLGVILHHTAEPTPENALKILSSPTKKAGVYVVIDTDGTRYIMAKTTVVSYHAGYSLLNGREGRNFFTLPLALSFKEIH